jgi:hypothetical protein
MSYTIDVLEEYIRELEKKLKALEDHFETYAMMTHIEFKEIIGNE